ncbi:MAG TPA: hypothetical protein P5026_01475 [Kiritimatiellia bacterium]|nr:hypothetical protein [Kiritimatiellia bacterium]HRR32745.1 hypothetical protein [Kiritimatiellia bacterium]HRU69832.1 hypothetical protein [Kiritimatiellia bacterium]
MNRSFHAFGWCLLILAGCCPSVDKARVARVFTPRLDREEVVLTAPDLRTIALDSGADIIDAPFALRWDGGWERPWTFVVSFDYRTEGVKGEAVALRLQPLKDDGGRAPTQLWPSTFTGKREDTYVLGESAAFRSVSVEVDLPNIIRKQYRFEWQRRFGHASGKVEVKNFKVRLVRHALHAIKGGEYEIKQTKYFCLKNIFFDERGEVTVDFAYPELNPVCRVDILDVKGKVMRTVESRGGRAAIDFPTRGYWTLEATAEYPDGTKITTPGCVAVCGKPIAHDLIRQSRYGMMIVLGTPDLWEKLGSRWDQRCIFPDNLKNNFKIPNATADAIFSFHNCPVPQSLRRAADRNRQGQFPPEDWEAYRAYIGKFMDAQPEFLKRKLNITGELDFQWRGTDEEYVKMCRIFVEEAKKRNPNVFITGPEASRIKLPYFSRLHKLGYFDLVDGINIHHYVDGTKPEGEYWEDFMSMFEFFREAKIDKPIYMTETGWTTGKGNYFVAVSYENQARYLTRSMALMSTENIQAIIWHVDFTMLDEFGAIVKQHEAAWPKPMLQAFATVTRNLSDVKGNMKLHRLGPKTYLASGRRANGSYVHVYWRSADEERVAPPVKNVISMEDYLGTPVAYDSRMTVSEDPVYIHAASDYEGPEWKEPPGGYREKPQIELATDWTAGRLDQGIKSAATAAPVPAEKWSDPANAPKLRIAYARDAGFIIEAEVKDTKHVQPYSRERLVEGDSMTFAFDVNKTDEWRTNDIWMNYKGHNCVEYSVGRSSDGRSEAFRRNCWIPDMKKFESVGANVRTNIKNENGVTRYWVWIPWANLGLDEQLRPGAKVGFAAALYSSDGGKVTVNRLFDGIVDPLDPMKYGVLELK